MRKKMLATLITAALILGLAGCGANQQTADSTTEVKSEEQSEFDYVKTLFDTGEIHEINIDISEEDWNELLENALDKPKAYVTATIDGEVYEDVRFSPKGNSSLFKVYADPSSNRYSFKLKFDKVDKDQTYHGLDQFVLNNSHNDPSYMRDYVCAWLFKQQGIPAALMSYTKLSINGEFYGVYMAAETEGPSYLKRVYDGKGTLYKPESEVLKERDGAMISYIREEVAKGNAAESLKNYQGPVLAPDYVTPGADLKYTDDDPESYTDIIDNEVTDIDEESVENLIKALKNLSEGNYDEAIDTSEVVRYFAVQNFVGNYDSYTSVMLHNYMLYESNDGILSMIPWDYNVAMEPIRLVTGGKDASSWTELINMGIDSPTYMEVALKDRPMIAWIYEDEEAYAEYEKTLEAIIDCIESGAFKEEMQRMYEQIRPYVAEDPTAFCTLEEFDDSYNDVINFCTLRAQSIKKQLNGELARVTADQNEADRVTYK